MFIRQFIDSPNTVGAPGSVELQVNSQMYELTDYPNGTTLRRLVPWVGEATFTHSNGYVVVTVGENVSTDRVPPRTFVYIGRHYCALMQKLCEALL